MKKIQFDYTKYMEIQRIVALNVATARGKMSRADLAKKAGVSYQHIYEIEEELKKPSLKVLERVAEALNIELYKLLREGNETEEVKPITLPVSHTLKKMMLIPDDIYELSDQLGDVNHEAWKAVRGALKGGIQVDMLRKAKKEKEG
jgi:transcriptional regulator with XRE-family HTH domain